MSKVTPLSIVPGSPVEVRSPRRTSAPNQIQVSPAPGLSVGPALFNPLSLPPIDPDQSPSMNAQKATQVLAKLTELARPFGLPVDTPENRVRTAQKIHDHYEALFIQQIGEQIYGDQVALTPSPRQSTPERQTLQALLLSEGLKLSTDLIDNMMAMTGLPDSLYDIVRKINEDFAVRYYESVTTTSVGPANRRVETTTTTTCYVNTSTDFKPYKGSQHGFFERRRWTALLSEKNEFSTEFWKNVTLQKHSKLLFPSPMLGDLAVIEARSTSASLLKQVRSIHRNAASVLLADHIRGGKLDLEAEMVNPESTPESASHSLRSSVFFTRSGIVQSTRFGAVYPEFGYRIGNGDSAYRFTPFATPEGYCTGLVFGSGDPLLVSMAIQRIILSFKNYDVDEYAPLDSRLFNTVVKDLNAELKSKWPDYIATRSANVSAVYWWRGNETVPTGAIKNEPFLGGYGYEKSYRVYNIGESKMLPEGPSSFEANATTFHPTVPDAKHGSKDGAIGKVTIFGKHTLSQLNITAFPGLYRWVVVTSPNINLPLKDLSMMLDEYRYYPVDHLANMLFQTSQEQDGYVVVTRLRGSDICAKKPGWFGSPHPIVVPKKLPELNPLIHAFTEFPFPSLEEGQMAGPYGTLYKIKNIYVQIQNEHHMLLPGFELVRSGVYSPFKIFKNLFIQLPLPSRNSLDQFELLDGLLMPRFAFASIGNVKAVGLKGGLVQQRGGLKAFEASYVGMVSLKDGNPYLAKKALWTLPRTAIPGKEFNDRMAVFDALSRFDTEAGTRFSMFLYFQANRLSSCCCRAGLWDSYVSTGGYQLFEVQPSAKDLLHRQVDRVQYFGRNPSGEYDPISADEMVYSDRKSRVLKPGVYAIATSNLVEAAGGVSSLASRILPFVGHISLGDVNSAAEVLKNYPSIQNAGLILFERLKYDVLFPHIPFSYLPVPSGPGNFSKHDAIYRRKHLLTLDPFSN